MGSDVVSPLTDVVTSCQWPEVCAVPERMSNTSSRICQLKNNLLDAHTLISRACIFPGEEDKSFIENLLSLINLNFNLPDLVLLNRDERNLYMLATVKTEMKS